MFDEEARDDRAPGEAILEGSGSSRSHNEARRVPPAAEVETPTSSEGSSIGRIASRIVESFAPACAAMPCEPVWLPMVAHTFGAPPQPPSFAVRGEPETAIDTAQALPRPQRRSLWSRLQALQARRRRARAIRRASLALEALDGHMLRDLGIERDRIWHAVRFGRWG